MWKSLKGACDFLFAPGYREGTRFAKSAIEHSRTYPHAAKMMTKLRSPLILSILAGVAIYVGFVIAGDQDEIIALVSKLGVEGWGLVLGLSLLNYGLRFARWQRYLGRLGHAVPPAWSMAYYLAGFAFTTTPGKVGEAVRSLYLKAHGVGYAHSLAALFAERFADLLSIVALSILAAFDFYDARWPVLITGGIVLGLLPVIHSRRMLGFVQEKSQRLSAKLRSLVQRLLFLLNASGSLLRSRMLYGGLVIGVLAWGAEGVGFYLILEYLGMPVSVTIAVGIYAISILVGAVSFLPGGLGSTEATMGLLLVLSLIHI
jgi:uncharacterized protein (TIRG00374 family)